ncbi:MAG: alkaline phosphatase family protein [Nanobdellota archaeon]
MVKPDYKSKSIVNLMSSIQARQGNKRTLYNQLEYLPSRCLKENILLVVIDGLGYEYLKQKKDSFLYKHLKEKITSVFPPTTAAAITTYATGVAPKQHAVTGWFMNLKETGSVTATLPFLPRAGGVGLEFLDFTVDDICEAKALSKKINSKFISIHPNDIINSEFNQKYFSQKFFGYNSLEGFIRQIKRASNEKNDKLIYAYWPILDKINHEFGVGSKESDEHFYQIDKKLERLKELKNTSIILTADHGFMNMEKEIHLEDHPKLKECLSMPLCGEKRAAYCYVYPERKKYFEKYVKDKLSKYCWLYTRKDMLDGNWYGLYNPNKKLFHRIGDYVLLMKRGCIIKDKLPAEKENREIGYHGGISSEEMYVPLVFIE